MECDLEMFHTDVSEFLKESNYISTCENLLIPVEEGISDSFKKGIQKIAKKFHDIFMAFKKWIKSVIQKIKSFFKKSNSEDGPDKEEAKKTLDDIQSVMSEASDVEVSFRDVTEENSNDVVQKADEVSAKMKDLKNKIETTYLAIPQSSESGNTKDPDEEKKRKAKAERYRDYINAKKIIDDSDEQDGYLHDQANGAKQAYSITDDMIKNNFFKFKNPKNIEEKLRDFILSVSGVENNNKTHFYNYKNSVEELIGKIDKIINLDPLCKESEGIKNMIRYMNTRCPRQVQDFVKSNQSHIKSVKASLLKANREIAKLNKSDDKDDIRAIRKDILKLTHKLFLLNPSIKSFSDLKDVSLKFIEEYNSPPFLFW